MITDHSSENIEVTISLAGGYDAVSCEPLLCALEEEQSEYVKKLNLLKSKPTHKLNEIGDQWRISR